MAPGQRTAVSHHHRDRQQGHRHDDQARRTVARVIDRKPGDQGTHETLITAQNVVLRRMLVVAKYAAD